MQDATGERVIVVVGPMLEVEDAAPLLWAAAKALSRLKMVAVVVFILGFWVCFGDRGLEKRRRLEIRVLNSCRMFISSLR